MTVLAARGYCHTPPPMSFFYFWAFCVFAGSGLLFFSQFLFFFWVLGGGVVGRGWVWVFFFSDHRLFFSATIVFCSQQFLYFVDLAQQHLCFSWMVRCIFVMACLCVFRWMAVRFCSIACFCSQRFCLPLSFNPWLRGDVCVN